MYGLCCTVVDNIELTKKIVTLSGLRWKIVSKTATSAREPVENRDVSKRCCLIYFCADKYVIASVTFYLIRCKCSKLFVVRESLSTVLLLEVLNFETSCLGYSQ